MPKPKRLLNIYHLPFTFQIPLLSRLFPPPPNVVASKFVGSCAGIRPVCVPRCPVRATLLDFSLRFVKPGASLSVCHRAANSLFSGISTCCLKLVATSSVSFSSRWMPHRLSRAHGQTQGVPSSTSSKPQARPSPKTAIATLFDSFSPPVGPAIQPGCHDGYSQKAAEMGDVCQGQGGEHTAQEKARVRPGHRD